VANRTWINRRTLLAACVCAELLIDTVSVTVAAARGDVRAFVAALVRLAVMGLLSYLLWRGHIWAGWTIATLQAMTALGALLVGALALMNGKPAESLYLLLALGVVYASIAALLVWLLLTRSRQKPPPLPVAGLDRATDRVSLR
jgi:hypothetical protein